MDDWMASVGTPMRLNAAFSLFSGAVLLLATAWIVQTIQLDAHLWLRGFGFALLAHGVALFWAAGHERRRHWAQLNLLAIAPYPIVLLALGATLVSAPGGQRLMLLDGSIIAALALWHALALHNTRAAASTTT